MELLDMSCEPFLINAGVTAILAQRLVRKLCTFCRSESLPTSEERESMKLLGSRFPLLYKSSGCINCYKTGYKGRVGIFQLLYMSDAMKKLLACKGDYRSFYDQASSEGMKTLAYAAAEKVALGVTSLTEVMRVLF